MSVAPADLVPGGSIPELDGGEMAVIRRVGWRSRCTPATSLTGGSDMRIVALTGTLAFCCAGTLALAQSTQQPAASPESPPRTGSQAEARSTTTQAATTTMTGCVYRERDVPGRTPNVAERVGVLEDYVLAEVAMGPGSGAGAVGTTGRSAGAPTSTTPAPAADSAAKKMYKLELVADDKLQAMVGKRVEVMGKIDAEPGDAPAGARAGDRSVGPDRIELPEFEVTSIREIAGTCPAAPAKP